MHCEYPIRLFFFKIDASLTRVNDMSGGGMYFIIENELTFKHVSVILNKK